MVYRKLNNEEINFLKSNGCSAGDWDKINVAEKFLPDQISNTNFGGEVFIGDNVQIRNVVNISNYTIEDNVVLENISALTVFGETTFGNGIKINVLNEGGGRELMMYDQTIFANSLLACYMQTQSSIL